jgi:hypothetical protein
MACGFISDPFHLVSSNDHPRIKDGTWTNYGDYDAAVEYIKSKFHFFSRRVSIQFKVEEQELHINIDHSVGMYGCPRVETIIIRSPTEHDIPHQLFTWCRQGEIAWIRMPRCENMTTMQEVNESLEKLVSLVKDTMVHGFLELALIDPHVTTVLAPMVADMDTLHSLKITSTTITEDIVAMVVHILTYSITVNCILLESCTFSHGVNPELLSKLIASVRGCKVHSFLFERCTCESILVPLHFMAGFIDHPTLDHFQVNLSLERKCNVKAIATEIGRILTSEKCKIKELRLNICKGHFNNTNDETLLYVLQSLIVNTSVVSLDFSGVYQPSMELMGALVDLLCVNDTIEDVNLEHADIDQENITAIASELSSMRHLKRLNLNGFGCTPKAVGSLEIALREQGITTLHSLKFQSKAPWSVCCTPPSYFYSCSDDVRRSIEYHLALNKCAHPVILNSTNCTGKSIPLSLWARVLEKAQTDEIYYESHSLRHAVFTKLKEKLPQYRYLSVVRKAQCDEEFFNGILSRLCAFGHLLLEEVPTSARRIMDDISSRQDILFTKDILFTILKSGAVPMFGSASNCLVE